MSEFLRCRRCGKILCASDTPLSMTSVDAARIFHKRHKNVMRDIKKLGLLSFEPSSYRNSQGRKMPCFTIDWDGLRLLSRRYRTPVEITLEIKNSKRAVRVFGTEKVEFVCDRCGEVSRF
jgi:Rha family phage regulatory protein